MDFNLETDYDSLNKFTIISLRTFFLILFLTELSKNKTILFLSQHKEFWEY